ncbi:MAG: pantoate--beta-alanine ligase [Paenibacillaceae bacterium]
MEVFQNVEELRLKLDGKKHHLLHNHPLNTSRLVGFVPTMGFLHAGHASLLEQARHECDIVVLSIFVNPLQFGPNEDFEQYPRDPERDLAIARQAGVDYVFMPETAEMYPEPIQTMIQVDELTDSLCGASRPGHFDGVATVVAKLLHIVEPNRVYFGMKDAQQVVIVTQMINDLNMRVIVVPCPTVREEDGLAMSSRNVYLSTEERKQALVLSQALQKINGWLEESGEIALLEHKIKAYIQTAPLAQMDYAKVLSYPSLKEIVHIDDVKKAERLIVALAVKFGRTRLIDNTLIEVNVERSE